MKDHDRFESLAGAIALGEATAAERATFSIHAATCALCGRDALDGSGALLSVVAAARDDETWRPVLDRAVLAGIRERRARHSRFTVGALGWAAALSIAVNVLFVTGLAGQVIGALRPTTIVPQVATFGIRLPARTFAQVPRVTHPQGMALSLALPRTFAKRVVAPTFSSTLANVPVRPAFTPVTAGNDISDLLDANGARASRKVAVQLPLPCDNSASCGVVAKDARP